MQRQIKHYQPIYGFGNQIGYLQVIETKGHKAVEIEYYLDKAYRKQGIMTTWLPIYLSNLEKMGIKNITALVKKRNYASKKLLKRNGFFKFNEFKGCEVFLNILKKSVV